MAGELYLVAREETREVLSVPSQLTRVPGAKAWIKGLANVRGALLPVIDLRQFLGSGATPLTRNTRVIVVNHREVPAGLLVDEVLGFRRFAEGEFSGDAPPTLVRCERFLAGAFRRGGEQWPCPEPAPAGRKPGVPRCRRLIPRPRAAASSSSAAAALLSARGGGRLRRPRQASRCW
jgi:chemotaxis signal transduction protein